MNKEDYVSLEIAKILYKNGFEIKGTYLWTRGVLCPTLYEAQKWIREKHDIHIVISSHYSNMYEVIEYEYMIATYFDFLEKPFKWRKSKDYYEKYEQCLNDGILEALKLIDYE